MEFDFSGIDTSSEEGFKVSFSRRVEETVLLFIDTYRPLFPDGGVVIQKIYDEKPGISALPMAYRLAISAGVKMFISIDEYDHFANDLIAMGSGLGDDVYRRMVRANGLVRDFYETLKTGTKAVIDRIFITGISPVMLDDLTSGFNIAVNLTTSLKYNEMMGFTRDEVDILMSETGVDPALINVDMETYYNGYLFHADGVNKVYNPSMVLYFFDQILRRKKVPGNIIDDNLKTDYGRLARLVQNEQNRAKLIKTVEEGGVSAELVSKFSIDSLSDDDYFISLLFYMGLLTIGGERQGNLTRLRIPNYSIRTVYWEYILRLTRNICPDIIYDQSKLNQAIVQLAYYGNPEPYVEYVHTQLLSPLSNRDLMGFDEKYVKILLLAGLFQSRIYVPRSEYETEGGYTDIYLRRSPLLPDIKYEWLWEIKYIKESDRRTLPAVRREAVEQMKRYLADREMGGREDLKAAVILFTGKKKREIIPV
jgi:hypothetical protein